MYKLIKILSKHIFNGEPLTKDMNSIAEKIKNISNVEVVKYGESMVEEIVSAFDLIQKINPKVFLTFSAHFAKFLKLKITKQFRIMMPA